METDFNSEYLTIVHTNPSQTTVDDVKDMYDIIFDENYDEETFVSDNAKEIFAASKPEDGYEAASDVNASNAVIRVGAKLKVLKSNIDKEIVDTGGNTVIPSDDFNAFIGDKIKEIILNEGYRPLRTRGGSETNQGRTYRAVEEYSVFIWVRALKKLMNVTPFVRSLSTNVSSDGGNFSMDLAPITAEYVDGQWIIPNHSISTHYFNGKSSFLYRDSILKKSTKVYDIPSIPHINDEMGYSSEFQQKPLFFHHILSPQDLVFIQFEGFEAEKKNREKDYKRALAQDIFFPEEAVLQGRFFDMIGLVDGTKKGYNPETNDIVVNASGRDMMKLLIEDGCYIYPTDFARGLEQYQGQTIKRLADGSLNSIRGFIDNSLADLINLTFNILSNIEVIDDEKIFSFYSPEDISWRYNLITAPENLTKAVSYASVLQNENSLARTGDVETVPAEGVWKIIKLLIDERISNYKVVDGSITSYQGSILNYVRKIAQQPFTEFYGDTYGNQYYFMLRRPPFTKSSFLDNFHNTAIVIDESWIYEEDLSFSDKQAYSWYRLRPQGGFMLEAISNQVVGLTTVYFDKYAKIFGTKSFDQYSNYIDLAHKNVPTEAVVDQMTQDLAYLIECHQYLPFTRSGTIRLKGERRLKRGNVFLHKGTNELFYIDAVANQATNNEGGIDRYTVLTVSRGMVYDFVKGVKVDGIVEEVSYFNIINLSKDNTGKSKDTNFFVNEDVFDFFLQKRQFA